MTLAERITLNAKIKEVAEAIEDLRTCFDPSARISLEDCRQRSRTARLQVAELLRFCTEDLS